MPGFWLAAPAPVYAGPLRNRTAAEDVVQDCICNLLRKPGKYDLLRDGIPLLMKSVTNACLKKNARDARCRKHLLSFAD